MCRSIPRSGKRCVSPSLREHVSACAGGGCGKPWGRDAARGRVECIHSRLPRANKLEMLRAAFPLRRLAASDTDHTKGCIDNAIDTQPAGGWVAWHCALMVSRERKDRNISEPVNSCKKTARQKECFQKTSGWLHATQKNGTSCITPFEYIKCSGGPRFAPFATAEYVGRIALFFAGVAKEVFFVCFSNSFFCSTRLIPTSRKSLAGPFPYQNFESSRGLCIYPQNHRFIKNTRILLQHQRERFD